MSKLHQSFRVDLDLEHFEYESPDWGGVMIGRDDTQGAMEECDGGKVSSMSIADATKLAWITWHARSTYRLRLFIALAART
jgi:hypothetical protein